jgi:hypothetical protein
MSEIKVNKISPKQTCTQVTLGDSGDTFIIPAGVTLTNSGTATGFGATGAVNWDTTPKTTTVTAVSGVGYFVDTTSGAVTVNLPATPSAGAIVGIADYAGTAATNNITIGRNGSNIEGLAVNGSIYVNRDSTTLVYVDSTQGWVPIADNVGSTILPGYVAATGGTILTCGNFKTHVFTGPGTFTVTCAGNAAGANTVEYLIVAGGGGASPSASGGGGAGGYRQNYPSPTLAGLSVTAQAYPITVGSGGTAGVPGGPTADATKGNDSIFSTITSSGGGTSGTGSPPNGQNGGSGAGVGGPPSTGGSGNTPPVSPPQGNNGGVGAAFRPSPLAATAGAGGGAGAIGGNAPSQTQSGAGGEGSPMSPTYFGPTAPSYGTPGPAPGRYFAGGGGGGSYIDASGGAGGSGGGGAGGGPPSTGTPGTANTGGGGGGGRHPGGAENAGGAGGSGIVIIRYKFQ